MHISNRCVSWKIATGAENPVLQALQFQYTISAANSQAGQAEFIADLMRTLWRVNLMLVLDHSLLNRGYILINVLKALASIVSMCSLHVIFLSKVTPKYFTLFTNGMFRPFNMRRESGGLVR
jgi:hypothetical protein